MPLAPAAPQGGPAPHQRPQDAPTSASPEALRRERLADAPTTAIPAVPAAGGVEPAMPPSERSERPTPAPAPSLLASQPEPTQADAPSVPVSGPLATRSPAQRELRVRVWEESETMIMPMEGAPLATPRREQSGQELPPAATGPFVPPASPLRRAIDPQPSEEKQTLEELPTMPLTVIPGPGLLIERASTPPPTRTDEPFSPPDAGRLPPAGLDELDTMHLAAQAALTTAPTSPKNLWLSPAEANPGEERAPQQSGAQPLFHEQAALQVPAVSRSSLSSEEWERGQWEQERAARPSSWQSSGELTAASPRRARRRSKRFVILGLLALILLLAGGALTAWIFVYQPFSVSPITQPQQTFRDQRLGLVLSYPNGWSSHVDYSQGEVSFSDSSHTGQIVIRVVAAGSESVAQHLQKEAASLGLSNLKSEGPATFAGTTWQEVEGTLLVAGASYIETLFVTAHAGRLYTFAQLADQQVYSAEEQQVFAPARASLRFLT